MKKPYFLVALAGLFMFAGCSNAPETVTEQQSSTTQTQQPETQTQVFELPEGTLARIPFEQKCDVKRTALPMKGICPQKNLIAKNLIEKEGSKDYAGTEIINSPEYGYAYIRSAGDFAGAEHSKSILATLSDGQEFCSGGYFLIRNSDGGQEGFAYYVLLQDNKGQYCRGVVWEGLVKKDKTSP